MREVDFYFLGENAFILEINVFSRRGVVDWFQHENTVDVNMFVQAYRWRNLGTQEKTMLLCILLALHFHHHFTRNVGYFCGARKARKNEKRTIYQCFNRQVRFHFVSLN